MCEKNHTHNGVYPLVCVACQHVVGVINAREFFTMVQLAESYICQKCLHAAETETRLADLPDDAWMNLMSTAIINPHAYPIQGAADGRA